MLNFHHMTNVQFEEDGQFSSGGSLRSRQILGMPATPGMVRLLGKFGIHDKKVAGYILITAAIAGILITLFFLFGTLVGSTIPPEALVQPEYGLPIKD